jgi:tRNA(adenine34) deaminase
MDQATAEFWMREALIEARKAEVDGEVPIGAVLLLDGKIIGRGCNNPIRTNDPTAHAEIVALREAARSLKNYRLPGSVLITTIEPCIMCVGAMIHARVEEVIYGAADLKAGAIESCFRMPDWPKLNHAFSVTSGILEQDCAEIIKNFFASRRKRSE